ncbi:hypothetical protein LEP1GSC166_1873 [Leptospira kirschneri]|uniref:hypothetical protein n=1 Tax=Leptospira kirschneri TaxID=29507 RepID=UPI0002BDA5D2|nr:hypothetical protein [Leptospira kirschneri]EMK02871.1 hypothetical protein LEP1GSC166_1873 [Leptospira kirschneri]
MKVKTLIKKLEKCNPEAIVEFGTASGSESGKVTDVFAEKNGKIVTLELVSTHFFGEKADW